MSSAAAPLSPLDGRGWQPRRPPWQLNMQALTIIIFFMTLLCFSGFLPTAAASTIDETADMSASEDKCLFNPLFHKPLAMFHHKALPYPSKPTVVPESAHFLRSCKTLNTTAPTLRSCCNTSTVEKFKHFAEEYDKTRLEFANVVNSLTVDSLYHFLADDDAQPTVNMTQQQNQSVARILVDLSMIADNVAQCSDAMMTYWQGMFCLACSEDSARYQSDKNDVGTILKLQPETCNAVWFACEPLVESVVIAVPDIVDAFHPFMSGSRAESSDCMTHFQKQVTDIIVPLRAAHVKSYFCQHAGYPNSVTVFDGMSYALGELPNNLQCLQCWIWRSQTAIHFEVDDTCNWVGDVVEPSYCHWCDNPYNLNGNATVHWVSGDEVGYDPYDVGCHVDGLSEYACGGSPSSTSGAATVDEWLRFLFIVVASVGVIILVLTLLFSMVCCTSRSRPHSSDLADQLIVNAQQLDEDPRSMMRSPSLVGGSYSEHTMADYYRGLDAVDDSMDIHNDQDEYDDDLDYGNQFPSSLTQITPNSLIHTQHAIN
ncbi:unnamed protein product [Sphagnum balticum]